MKPGIQGWSQCFRSVWKDSAHPQEEEVADNRVSSPPPLKSLSQQPPTVSDIPMIFYTFVSGFQGSAL